eukprot:Skav220570  [mRNA]  locus=scaffold145:56599:74515:- [translate_table: standard]
MYGLRPIGPQAMPWMFPVSVPPGKRFVAVTCCLHQTMTDVFVDASAVNWTSGAFYQAGTTDFVAFTAESEKNVLIEGVTPGSDYHIHCWSVDAANTEGPQQQALADTFSPPSFRIALGDRLYLIKAVRLVVPTDGRPEQSAEWSVFVAWQQIQWSEIFCYSEDLYGNLQYSMSAPLTVKTTDSWTNSDTTAPKLHIRHIYPMDLSITVEVGLEDPGDAYPALARCMATTQDYARGSGSQEGRAPQEHDAYFEHRFWRIRFITTYTEVEPACADRVLLRSLDLQSWGGETFRKPRPQKFHRCPSGALRVTHGLPCEDPLLEMMGFQDAAGNLLAAAPRDQLRRMALIAGEKLLKAERGSCHGKVDRVEWPFEASGVEAPHTFASGCCRISPELPVIPKNTLVTISLAPDSPGMPVEYISEGRDMTAGEVIKLIGLDTDDNNLIDSYEIAAWSVPVQDG